VLDAVTRRPLTGRRQLEVTLALLATVALIGAVDAASGSGVSFGAFYLAPVIAASVFCGPRPAVMVAVAAALTWSTADAVIVGSEHSHWFIPVNVAIRLVTFGIVIALITALRTAVDDARRSQERSQDFLAFAAHQLRTPIAAASAAAQTLLADGKPAEQEELLVRIVDETNRSGRLVASVLQFLRVDYSAALPRGEVDLRELCREATERNRRLASELVTRGPEEGPSLLVSVNRTAVSEALDCLLDNARRHARNSISLDAYAVSGHAVMKLVDDGPGLPSGKEDEVFTPFVSMDRRGGTGLGLAIARGLIEAQHGTLTYASGEFNICFPISPLDHQEPSVFNAQTSSVGRRLSTSNM
jgi:signal transduction histidine kinase